MFHFDIYLFISVYKCYKKSNKICYNSTNRTPQASAAFWQYAQREGA